MKQPFFSICIPTYNRAHLLPEALESSLAQTDSDFEIVIVDNASTDNTQEVLKRYDDPRIRVIKNTETVSMYANHNLCVEQAQASWVVFLHSDDKLRVDALKTLRNRIHSQPCDVVYPAKQIHHNHTKFGDLLFADATFIPALLRWPAGTPSGAAYKKTLLSKIKFDECLVVSDLILLAEVLLYGSKILISADDTVKIGEGDFQYSSKWHKSGGFIADVSKAFKRLINMQNVLKYLEDEIDTWSDSEITFLLMMLSHAGERQIIFQLQKKLIHRTSYKKDRKYRHVFIYKIFGVRGLFSLFKAIKYLRNI